MKKYSLCPNLQLRRVGKHYMVVAAADGMANYADVFTLNESAARMWQCLEAGSRSADDLSEHLAAAYGKEVSDVAPDVEKQLSEWIEFGLVVCV